MRSITSAQARALEHFLKTLDRFDTMEPYIITAEMKPGTSLNKYSDIVYDQEQHMYGLVIRIMTSEGIKIRIQINDEETRL